MRIVLQDETGLYYARPMELDLDLLGFTAAMMDWPADEYGGHTIDRCANVARRYCLRNLDALHEKMNATTSFEITLPVCDEKGGYIGFWRTKVTDNHTHVSQLAIIPRRRGQGHFTRMEYLFGHYHRRVLESPATSWETTDNAPATKHRSDKFNAPASSTRVGKMGNKVAKHAVDLARYDANLVAGLDLSVALEWQP